MLKRLEALDHENSGDEKGMRFSMTCEGVSSIHDCTRFFTEVMYHHILFFQKYKVPTAVCNTWTNI